jgi:hypothetical protein
MRGLESKPTDDSEVEAKQDTFKTLDVQMCNIQLGWFPLESLCGNDQQALKSFHKCSDSQESEDGLKTFKTRNQHECLLPPKT